MKADLAVVGGGPAGLAAAAAAAELGLDVVVVDEAPVPGGRLRGQVHQVPAGPMRGEWRRGSDEASRLLAAATRAGARILSSTTAWGLFPGWRLALQGPGDVEDLEAAAVILATGGAERPLALPGWTLPGVLCVGAAQSLLHQYRVRPGDRALIVGIDALSLHLAHELILAGVEVAAVVLPPPGDLSGERGQPAAVCSELIRLARLAPAMGLRLAGELARGPGAGAMAARLYPRAGVRAWGVPIMARRAALAIHGDATVETVLLADLTAGGQVEPGTERAERVDVVVLSGGISPLADLALQAGCRVTYVAELGGHMPLHGPDLATTLPGVYVAGTVTGVEGAQVAAAQGRLAGLAAAAGLGRLEHADRQLTEAREAVAAGRREAPLEFRPGIAAARARLEGLWSQQPAGSSA